MNNVTRWNKEDPPNLLLAIDPGASYPGRQRKEQVPYAGCALFQWSELVWASLVKCPTMTETTPVPPYARPNALVKRVCAEANVARFRGKTGETLNVLVVENPRIYTKGKARPADIVALARIYGAFMGGIDAEFYSGPAPSEWKGSIDGKVLNERVLTVTNADERIRLMKAQKSGRGGLSDHVLDAVGLGLFTLGRADVAMGLG